MIMPEINSFFKVKKIYNFPDLSGSNFFITGGTGFIGIWMLLLLLTIKEQTGQKFEITILTRNPKAFKQKAPRIASQVTIVNGSLENFACPESKKYDYVLHAAIDSIFSAKDSVSFLDSMTQNTKCVLEFALSHDCKKFLFISSGAVYGGGINGEQLFSESQNSAPTFSNCSYKAIYGEGKRLGELLSSLYAQKGVFETKIARPFTFIGPYLPLDANYAVGNFINNALNNEPIIVNSDGTSLRSYMYAADMAEWLLTILFYGENSQPYNVGSNVPISILGLAKTIASVVGYPDSQIVVKSDMSHKPDCYVPSTALAEKHLGLKINYSLEDSVRSTIEWHKGRL